MIYIVVTEDAGEYGHDWSLAEYVADSPEQALELALRDGYGDGDSLAWVFERDTAARFELSARRGLEYRKVEPHSE